jgi:hypothetical protein
MFRSTHLHGAHTWAFLFFLAQAMVGCAGPSGSKQGSDPQILGIERRAGGAIVVEWAGETGKVYSVNTAHVLGHNELFYPLRTSGSDVESVLSITNMADPSGVRFYRVEEKSSVGAALVLSDVHLNPFASTNVATQLVARSYTKWREVLAPLTNEAFFAKSEWGESVTSYKLFDSALNNAQAVVPEPDMILYLGDFPVHNFRDLFIAYTGDATDEGFEHFAYKLIGFVGDEVARRFPGTPVFAVLGNNDSYDEDYQQTPEGLFFTDMAGLFFTNGLSNATSFAAFAPNFQKSGYYSVALGTGAQAIALCANFLSVLYTNPSGFIAYDPATNQIQFLDQELTVCGAEGKGAWVLVHILPGVDAYATYQSWKGQGDLTNVVEMWKDEYLGQFMQVIARHSNIVRQVFTGHTHMREFRLVSDPLSSNVVAAVHVAPGIDYTHGNNPAFQVLTFDRGTFEVRGAVTYALSRDKYTGATGPALWDEVFSYNPSFGIHSFAWPVMEGVYEELTNNAAACEVYRAIYETGRGHGAINSNNWPVYSTAIRWMTVQQFMDHFEP